MGEKREKGSIGEKVGQGEKDNGQGFSSKVGQTSRKGRTDLHEPGLFSDKEEAGHPLFPPRLKRHPRR